MLTYFASSGPYYFWNRDDVVIVTCLVKDYTAAETSEAFQSRAVSRLVALAHERGEPYTCLPVHRVYRDLLQNFAVKLGQKEGSVSCMIDHAKEVRRFPSEGNSLVF